MEELGLRAIVIVYQPRIFRSLPYSTATLLLIFSHRINISGGVIQLSAPLPFAIFLIKLKLIIPHQVLQKRSDKHIRHVLAHAP